MTRTPALNHTDPLAASFRHCREVTRRHARNFYYGLRLTPEPRRSAMFAVYAWMRRADDEADTPKPAGERGSALTAFRNATRDAVSGRTPTDPDPLWPAFIDTLDRYPIRAEWIEDLLDGVESDLGPVRFPAESDLDEYCDRVASTVGLTSLAIWGLRDGADTEQAHALAVLRGRAFQRTNILRDFGEDFDAGRVYLPEAWFERAGLTPGALREWNSPDVCAAFIRDCAAQAVALYDASAPLDAMVSADCVPVLQTMTRIYRALLDEIARRPHRVARGPRPSLPALRKARIALGATIAGAAR